MELGSGLGKKPNRSALTLSSQDETRRSRKEIPMRSKAMLFCAVLWGVGVGTIAGCSRSGAAEDFSAALVEMRDEGTIAWNVRADGTVKALVKSRDEKPIIANVSGKSRPTMPPSELSQVDGVSACSRAKGLKLGGELHAWQPTTWSSRAASRGADVVPSAGGTADLVDRRESVRRTSSCPSRRSVHTAARCKSSAGTSSSLSPERIDRRASRLPARCAAQSRRRRRSRDQDRRRYRQPGGSRRAHPRAGRRVLHRQGGDQRRSGGGHHQRESQGASTGAVRHGRVCAGRRPRNQRDGTPGESW